MAPWVAEAGAECKGHGVRYRRDASGGRDYGNIERTGTGTGKGKKRVEALRLAEAFEARVCDANTSHFVFEITGRAQKVDQFIAIMTPLGLIEVCRTGVAAMNRGKDGM